jgi:hypothetical protein
MLLTWPVRTAQRRTSVARIGSTLEWAQKTRNSLVFLTFLYQDHTACQPILVHALVAPAARSNVTFSDARRDMARTTRTE